MSEQLKRGRGKAKKPALVLVSMRVDADVHKAWQAMYPSKYQAMVRQIMREHLINKGVLQNANEQSSENIIV